MLKKLISTRSGLAGLVAVLVISTMGGLVHADQYTQQIQAIEAQNAAKQEALYNLQIRANTYQEAIDKLQSRINQIEGQILKTQSQQAVVKRKIADAQKQLDHQKLVLGEAIKSMYIDSETSTLEVLLSSDNLSDFVNQEQYHITVQNNVKSLVEKITALKQQLKAQNDRLTQLLTDQRAQQSQVLSARAEQDKLLSYNQEQQTNFTNKIAANNAKILELQAEQRAANQRLINNGSVSIISQGSCGGGYPANASGPNGNWGCAYGLDNAVDPWSMYNQECVSYTAWKVAQTYGNMPTWGTYPNANADHWPSLADAYKIRRGNTPKIGSVAVGTNPAWFGSVGHTMWVEDISGDKILVSQMNFAGPGVYSKMWISTSLISTFIYFGG